MNSLTAQLLIAFIKDYPVLECAASGRTKSHGTGLVWEERDIRLGIQVSLTNSGISGVTDNVHRINIKFLVDFFF